MKAEVMPEALADTVAEIEAKTILRDIRRFTDKGNFQHDAPKPCKGEGQNTRRHSARCRE